MKKLTLILLSVLMIVTLAACGSKKCEQHVYDDCADTECNVCGDKRDSMHSWNAADCDTPKTCTVCGATEGSALGHKPSDDDGDCTTGITCTVCGTTTTPARESHTGGTATCTEKALCTVCSTAYGAIDANNHIDENTDHICDRDCGKTDIGTHADSAEDNDHVCDYGCGATLEDHKGGIATCVDGKICDICGVEYDKTKNPDNHASTEFTYTNNGDGTHNKLYACCEAVHTANEACSGGTATCVSGKICDFCETAYGDVDSANHASENYTYTDNGDGTHTKTHECGVVINEAEAHIFVDGKCDCGVMKIVVSFDAGDFEWKTGDTLYFCRVSRDNQWEEYCFTATVAEDGTVTWTPDKPLYWDGTGEHKLVVKYPGDSPWAWDRWYVPADQSTLEKLKAADHMNAMWKGNPTTDPINLNLKHRLSMVTVTYTLASEFEPDTVITPEVYSNTQYMIFDIHTLERRNVEWQEGHEIWVTPYQHEGANGEKQFTAIVSPDAYSAGDDFIRIKIGDQVLSVKMPEAKTLEEGGEYTFDVKVGQDVLTIEEVSMGDIDSPFGDGWHNEIDLRAIGTQDVGKTYWEVGDQIIVTFTSPRFGTQYGTLTYDGTVWSTDVSFSYLEGETPTVSAIYAPCYEVVDGNMQLKDGMHLGMTEYISAACSITDGTLNISFEGTTRNYSRLRISALPGQTLTVTTTGFTPAGATEAANDVYTLTADENGNIYLYGAFAEGATVSVKKGEVTLANYTFTAEKHPDGSKSGINYALDARPIIDGTLGGKTTATEEDINALVDQLKAYVDNGITTIVVTGSEPAMIEVEGYTISAIGAAIYRLSGNGNYDENNPYNGKIDLILSDVTEIVATEFYAAFALNSITLPKVTTVGDGAFTGCYYLKKMTFGSVVTSINQSNHYVFYEVGKKVDGGLCDLVLNCGQLQAEDTYKPDLENNVWFKPSWGGNVSWKSITLTHTGECDECTVTE